MYVRKFEADTIEEALKEIKRELGPDAVVLKTVTNKGLKGAFKKKKIEVTAAISEKNYVKKAHVDSVLNENEKQEFYNGSAGYISNMIDRHAGSDSEVMHRQNKSSPSKINSSYGHMGLNRAVNSTTQVASHIKNGLDDFLNLGQKSSKTSSNSSQKTEDSFNFDDEINYAHQIDKFSEDNKPQEIRSLKSDRIQERNADRTSESDYSDRSKSRIDELEKRLYELAKSFERIHKKEPTGIYQLRTILKSLDINETFIQQIIKKASFELTNEKLENVDDTIEFSLKEMLDVIKTDGPSFLNVSKKTATITVFLSDLTSGQSLIIQKICAQNKDAVIINYQGLNINPGNKNKFSESILGLNIHNASTIPEIVSECRKAAQEGRSVFIDFKGGASEINETKKFIDGLKRSFSNVEVLITLSAIHSEIYNRKVLNTYRPLADGVNVTHLDECLNFGSLFNLNYEENNLPYKYFSTGKVSPDDLEMATPERLMSGIFKLN